MIIILKPEVYRIKNGFAVRSPELRLTAHGATIDLAKRNLEKTIELFLKPFEREGVLADKINMFGLEAKSNGTDLIIEYA